MNDKIFGKIERHIDSWIGELSWKFPCSGTETIRFTFRAKETGPTDEERALFLELTNRYEELWPAIALKLVELNPMIKSASELQNFLRPRILLFIPGIVGKDFYDFTLGYEFEKDESSETGYFVSFVDWNIVSALKAL